MEETIVWKDRKRIFFGLPWTFTKYALTEEKLYIETGVLSKREEEVRLYRIMDVTLKRSLWERICGLGTIHCCSADKSAPEFDLLHIKKSHQIKNMLSERAINQDNIVTLAGKRQTACRRALSGPAAAGHAAASGGGLCFVTVLAFGKSREGFPSVRLRRKRCGRRRKPPARPARHSRTSPRRRGHRSCARR